VVQVTNGNQIKLVSPIHVDVIGSDVLNVHDPWRFHLFS